MLEWGRRWWRQTEQFDWVSVYLRDRGLQRQWRLATFATTLLLAALPVVMLGSRVGPDNRVTAAVAVAAAIGGASASMLWLRRWPTRRQSVAYGAICCLSTAATCLALSDPYAGLMGCTLFTVLGGLLAYFHSVIHVLANLGVAAVCAAITAGRLIVDTADVSLAMSALIIVATLNIGVPFGIQSLVHTLGTDLRNSDHDPLTGLLNRRAFYNAVHELTRVGAAARLNVTMVDLDEFKRLNDTKGHVFGDQALVGVAVVLREHSGPDAVLARLGGEEFVLADNSAADHHADTIERVRRGIAATSFEITASFGTCSAAVDPTDQLAHPEFVDRLIQVADAAMYQSKRAGGDRIHHRHLRGNGQV